MNNTGISASVQAAPLQDGQPPHVISVIPSLFPEAWKRRLMQPLRIWYLMRALDRSGCGRLVKRDVLTFLQDLGWSRATIYRLIKQGQDVLWRSERTRPSGNRGASRKTLVLTGAQTLAASWGLERLSPFRVELPWELFAGDVAAWNAMAYHAWFGPGPNHPYSRAKIHVDTGVSRRTQIRHHALHLPGTRRRVTRKQPNYATYQVELASKSHMAWGLKRLGNTYASSLPRRGWGQGRAFNRRASGEFRPHAHGAIGSSFTGRARRFFERLKPLLRAVRQGQPLYPDPMLQLASHQKDAPAVARLRRWAGLWELLELPGRAVA